MKRFFDILLSLLVLTVGLPFGLLIALLIVVDSKGSVIYRQSRVGRNNVDFLLYKFRTMCVEADKGSQITIGEDDVRITRGALRPYQFLTTIPLETPASELAYAAFDGDLVMTPYTNFFGEAGTASAFTSGGAAPVFTRDRPGRAITAGKDGDVLKDVNRGALAFSGGKVEYAKRALVADEETFTAEFFVKCASAASGAGLVKVVRGADEATDPLIWSLGFADASGNLALKVCTDGETPQSHTFGGAVADGAWHHVAVRFSAGGTDGTAEVFRDGVQLGAWTFNGRLPSRPRAADLVIGAGDDATAGFTGVLDELRMTAGFLSAERFMYAYTPGLACVIR